MSALEFHRPQFGVVENVREFAGWQLYPAWRLAVEALGSPPGHILVDGNRLPRWTYQATAIVGGDGISMSIAAASIVAKHTRDTIMIAHAESYPHYGWHSNKGYSAPEHLRALREHGPCPLHRKSFAPVAQAARPQEISVLPF